MKPKTNYTTEAGVSNPKDRCQTPAYALDPLVLFLKPEWTIWEPASGDGYLIKALRAAGLNQLISGELLKGQDYFAAKSVPAVYDVQVTNPPFSRKFPWLTRAYKLGKPFALLMPLDTLGAVSAQTLFERYGMEMIVFDKRINYIMPNAGTEGGGAQFPSAWFTHGLEIGKPITYAHIESDVVKREARRLQLPLLEAEAS